MSEVPEVSAAEAASDAAKLAVKTGEGVFDFGEYSGQGFKEDIDPSELATPYLKILQVGSQQVQDIDTAKAGHFYNSVTGEVIKAIAVNKEAGLVFAPVKIVTMFVENVPYNDGGDYIASHQPDSDYVIEAVKANAGKSFGKIPCAGGKHVLAETKYVFGLILDEEGKSVESYAILPLTSVKLGPLKKWLTAMYTVKAGKPPLYAFRSRIQTIKQKNKNKPDSFNIVVTPFVGNWKETLANPYEAWGKGILTNGQKMTAAIDQGIISVDFKSISDDEDDEGKDSSSNDSKPGSADDAPY